MSIRALISVFLVAMAFSCPASADPEITWSQENPPNFLMVADFSPDQGLEGLYADDISEEVFGVSLADFHSLGRLPNLHREINMEFLSLNLDNDNHAEVVVLKRPNISNHFIAAYDHNGGQWTEKWRIMDGYDEAHSDLQMVDLNGDVRGSYLLATGQSLELMDPATGLVVWSSRNSAEGLGSDWILGNWTLANFDQDPGGTEELLAEFGDGHGQHQLLMIGEVSAAAATPLQSTIISLGPSRPNPMFGATTVHFELPESSLVRLNIYDVRGRRVTTLANRTMSAGSHALRWDGNDRDGARVAQGVYFYELKAAGQQRTRKMIVVR